jgi:YbbR domain-containing protein
VSILPGFLARHWQLKISALAMAVLLWTVPRFEAISSEVLEAVPVRVQLDDPRYARLGSPDPATIRVTLSGPTGELLRVERPPVWIQVDSVVSRDTTILLTRSMVRMPAGVEGVVVEELSPDTVRLTFEEIIDRTLVLVSRTKGTLPDGLSQAGPIEVAPEIAKVSGPESRLVGLDSLFLMPLDLGQVRGSGPFIQPADTSGLQLTGIFPAQATLQVWVEETKEREFPNLPYVLLKSDSSPRIQSSPATVTVTLRGARSLVDAVAADGLRVIVPLVAVSFLSPGQETQVDPVVEGVPPFVEARVTPEWVTLRRPVGL